MGGHTIDELARYAACFVHVNEKHRRKAATLSDIWLAVRVITAQAGGALYADKIVRRVVDIRRPRRD